MGWTAVDNSIIRAIADIGLTTFSVYVVVKMHANDTGECWPSVATIARTVGLSARTIQYAIGRLCTARLIVKVERPGRATLYRLTPATSCTPSADGDAPSCTTPLQPVAPRTIPRNKTKERSLGNKRARGKAAAVVVEFPEGLATDVFRAAWKRWTAHRGEIRKALTPTTIVAQLRKLSAMGEGRAVAAINRSIECGWIGIFEESSTNGNGRVQQSGVADPSRPRNGKPIEPRYYRPKTTSEATAGAEIPPESLSTGGAS